MGKIESPRRLGNDTFAELTAALEAAGLVVTRPEKRLQTLAIETPAGTAKLNMRRRGDLEGVKRIFEWLEGHDFLAVSVPEGRTVVVMELGSFVHVMTSWKSAAGAREESGAAG